ncbi:hypothetical protein JL475_19225 [Streptomyces sp. M2CJ-2]|uniref:hypothetical protein n=1 Tax=Streptomyces sp. M2CJ-2 TaxID=2803948 RepID=UPI0019294227|nr:hypothetical protein [Streptomyces sp. M2CJ-2]MBL3668085.1 hypothetical protein [Streptomyces sp. M2CJ-2]
MGQIMSALIPEGLTPADEGTHLCPPGFDGLWGDTFWVSVVDPEANVHGVNHFHLTNKGYARLTAFYIIDGEHQWYGNKIPFDAGQGGITSFGDERISYEVVRPFEEIRIRLDGTRFAFDLTFTGRFQAFNYDNFERDPMKNVGKTAVVHGGHWEQALAVTGTVELRHGPNRGDVRQIDSFGFRDRSWSTRFSEESPWADSQRPDRQAHFWPSISLPERHISLMGITATKTSGDQEPVVAGFVSDKDGSREVKSAEMVPVVGDLRTQSSFGYRIELADGEVLNVRTTDHFGTIKLWDRGENDLENRFDCYEPFVAFEVEETGERGVGVCEYSVIPPRPRWQA